MKKSKIITKLTFEKNTKKSAWTCGVHKSALKLVDSLDSAVEYIPENIETALLNGAENWREYSCGGNGLIYDCLISEVLCTPSALKKCKGGERRPNSRENWLDVETRALPKTCLRIKNITRRG